MQNVSNVLEYLERNCATCGDKIAVEQEDIQLSYKELTEVARKFGSVIARETVSKEPVVILAEKSPLTLAAMFGTVYAGCFYVPVHPQIPVERIEKILHVLEAKVVVTTLDMEDKLKECGFEGSSIYIEEIQ